MRIVEGTPLKFMKKVYVELENSVERTDVELTEIQKLSQILPMNYSISGTIHIKKNTENYRNMQEFFKDCKAKALLETWRKLNGSDNET